MNRFDSIHFADLTGPGGGQWVRIGGGSFGVVYKGEYLGTEVAIKEVLPNNTYDVEKYFERECVLMKEARHPNIVQYIGVSKSPDPDGRVYIVSEFVGGNMRSYIADKHKTFDWPLRMSFATDVARAVAYLHARQCLHRDLKGENLLITANNRVKVCDFGFARIAARNEEEMRRMSFCGTDGYMSPEILMGVDFSLPTDIFSLGVIFCEIASRHLVDANTFKRQMPTFGVEESEIREMASKGCPEAFIRLCIDCVAVEPEARPEMRDIVRRLRDIEQDVLTREAKAGTLQSVGSLRGSSLKAVLNAGSKRKGAGGRPGGPPRLPSFNGQVKVGEPSTIKEEPNGHDGGSSSEGEDSDEDMEEALAALERVGVHDPLDNQLGELDTGSTFKVSGHGNPWWSDEQGSALPSLRTSWTQKTMAKDSTVRASSASNPFASGDTDTTYSTSVVRPSKNKDAHAALSNTLSTMTVKQEDVTPSDSKRTAGRADRVEPSDASTLRGDTGHDANGAAAAEGDDDVTQSFMTARSHRQDPSIAMATIASSTLTRQRSPTQDGQEHYHDPLVYHRFTLVKNGMRKPTPMGAAAAAAASGQVAPTAGSMIPPGLILANALAKCYVCGRRLGFGAFMDCDDCPVKTHVACAQLAEPSCLEMQIPGTPVLSAVNASRRASRQASGGSSTVDPLTRPASPAATALARQAALGEQQRAASPPAVAGAKGLFKGKRDKRSGKSPPPAQPDVTAVKAS
ncbi:kinase-like protein [Ceraceosorus bombacis]|uniref:Kinase-like protein n=1 Tax=Ceraceosorus bombacis TaxID=401625 RepID=A0A0P1BM78_9BASI|nr:kinase-like protein [Ceraceosorus bombacis]